MTVTVRSGFFGHCGAAYSYEHANAGRAYRETWTGASYAVESDDYLGPRPTPAR